MSRSVGICTYCKGDWDDAHWFFGGDDGGYQYPNGMCFREWRDIVPKEYRKMFKSLLKDVREQTQYEIEVALMRAKYG
jgi:hypothetical protein